MPIINYIVTTCVAVLLLAAVCRDVATRTIPDIISILIVLLGLTARAQAGMHATVVSMAISVALFGLLAQTHRWGMIGGGDVKLISAVSCGLSPVAVWHFVLTTALAGGVLACLYLLPGGLMRETSGFRPAARGACMLHRVFAIEWWRIARRRSLPYGVAIGFGGIATMIFS